MTEDPTIKLENVAVYQQKNLVLSNVSLTLSKGEFAYLIGKTGSGKSSLLKILYGELKISEGYGRIAGFELKNLKSRKIPYLRRKLGIVFQDFQLLSDRTVKDNLLFVLKATGWKDRNKINDRIKVVLLQMDLATKGFKMPHELSGGEQQRLVLARALLNYPEVILADEPSGNLDPATTREIMNLLFEISKSGTAVLMATHNYTLFEKYPARIIKCEMGKIYDHAAQTHE